MKIYNCTAQKITDQQIMFRGNAITYRSTYQIPAFIIKAMDQGEADRKAHEHVRKAYGTLGKPHRDYQFAEICCVEVGEVDDD